MRVTARARLVATLALLPVTAWAAGAQRIISTAPSITETLFAMGLGSRVVGVTIYCNFPPEAQKLPRIGTLLKPNVEIIVSLKPDLVVFLKQPSELPQQLTRLQIPFVGVDNANLDGVYTGARLIGKAAGAGEAAERWIHDMQSQLQQLKKLAEGRPKPTVAFIVGHAEGRLEGMFAGGGNSYLSDLLNCAGGTNIFADTSIQYPKISLEEILSRDPDAIIDFSGDTRSRQQQLLSLWQSKGTLKAVRSGHVYALDPEPFLIPGPRAVEAAKRLLHLLHPEIKP